MNGGEIDRIPVNQLMQRYGLVKSAVYKRLNDLGIDPQKVGNKSFVNAEQLRLLDDLHQFIKSGGTMPEFLESRGIQPAQNSSSGDSSGLSNIQPDAIDLVLVIADQVANRLQPPQDPLAYYQKLEDAARNGWLMRTSEIADLLDLSISEMQYYGDCFSEAGFTFTKSGYRAGGETAWKVSKKRS
ncbi:hypothetical protein P7L53_17355 [Thermoleptolyngbya sichuanensis XZ-Cy5]|uniref:hypothetical protein n=1 Tax=Thermoleptolyngbya sichuanensis TaxID=2885951 RepID=UPI00240E98AF|nr:hypothetical protein [Thermoleptolyngbya sichuanensis]MDG2618010.1 hypothetical protein [Thermoleptolyngbya sichuanensis XZ-Cy5]